MNTDTDGKQVTDVFIPIAPVDVEEQLDID